ncbi:MAG: sigma-70 family RNA polymerase sigma factor [Lachnospiraceae bacterium]|nr:sigma-70 family RNA polymerase sigma factor [Lachnospiraceae bacterium]
MTTFGSENTERIIRQYSDMIYRIAVHNCQSPADAEDILQDVFVELLTKCPCRDDPEHLKAWLIRVTVNKCKSLHRLAWRRKNVSLDECPDLVQPEDAGVMEEIRQLPENMCNIIYLYYYEDYTIAEIAEILGKNQNTVSSTLQRARRKLRDLLEEGDANA